MPAINPVKRNAFKVTIPDLDIPPEGIASCNLPEIVFETDEHTEANYRRETPSIVNVSDIELVLYEDSAVRNGFYLARIPIDQATGALRSPDNYEFDMVVEQLALDRATVIRRWTCKGCWIKTSRWENAERTSAENQMRTLVIHVTSCIEEDV